MAYGIDIELRLLEGGEIEKLVGMDSAELGLAVVDVVGAAPEGEIDYVDAVNFADVGVVLAALDVLGHEFGRAEEHTLEIGYLRVVLNLDENQLVFGILGEDVDAVVLVGLVFLVALAFEEILDCNLLVEESREKPLKDREVGLVAKEAFHCPIETDEFIFGGLHEGVELNLRDLAI